MQAHTDTPRTYICSYSRKEVLYDITIKSYDYIVIYYNTYLYTYTHDKYVRLYICRIFSAKKKKFGDELLERCDELLK